MEIDHNPNHAGNGATRTIYLNIPETCTLDIADAGGATLEEIGAWWGITRERVRQIEAKALRKLGFKHKPARRLLEGIMEDWESREQTVDHSHFIESKRVRLGDCDE